MLKTLHLPKLYFEDFLDKLDTILSNNDIKGLEGWRGKFSKRQMSGDVFV